MGGGGGSDTIPFFLVISMSCDFFPNPSSPSPRPICPCFYQIWALSFYRLFPSKWLEKSHDLSVYIFMIWFVQSLISAFKTRPIDIFVWINLSGNICRQQANIYNCGHAKTKVYKNKGNFWPWPLRSMKHSTGGD